MGTPRLLDRFITAAEAFDKDFLEYYLLKTFLNKVEEALAKANWLRPASMETVLALAIWSKVLFCIFLPFTRLVVSFVGSCFVRSRLFCCGFIVGIPLVRGLADFVASFVFSSGKQK